MNSKNNEKSGSLAQKNLFFLFLFIGAVLFALALPARAEAAEKKYHLLLDVKSDGNWFLDKYDTEIYWDKEKIDTLSQDGEVKKLLTTSDGTHTFSVRSAEKSSIVSSKKVTVTSDTTVSCTVKTHSDTIDVNDFKTLKNADSAKIKISDLSDKLLPDAINELKEAGFENVSYKNTDGGKIKKTKGWMVTGQEPPSGKGIFPDEAVSVTCINTDDFIKKNITGKSVSDAVKNAGGSGVNVRFISTRSGRAIDTSGNGWLGGIEKWSVDDAGYDKGIFVKLKYDGGADVPDVTGMSLSKAQDKLAANELCNIKTDAYKKDGENYIVISQDIPAGTSLSVDDKITLSTVKADSIKSLADGTATEEEKRSGIISSSSDENFAAMLAVSDSRDPSVQTFAEQNAGKLMALSGNIAYISNTSSDPVSNMLVRTGTYNQRFVGGPAFQALNVKLSDTEIDDKSRLKTGDDIILLARVQSYDAAAHMIEIVPCYIKISNVHDVASEKDPTWYPSATTSAAVQTALNSSGYDCGVVDGSIGPGTRAVIAKYETDHHLAKTDGTVDFELLAYLGVVPAGDPTPTPTPTAAPTFTPTPTPYVNNYQTAPEQNTENNETYVWVSRTGKCYHSRSSCSNMKNPSQITLSAAEARGLRPCSKCW